MTDPSNIDVPPAWLRIDLANLNGLIMVVGGPDVGKTTFCQYLFYRLRELGVRVAFLDGDPGQSTIGPPTMMHLSHSIDPLLISSEPGETHHWFVGSISPSGHMLSMLVGAARLVNKANELGAETIIYDTSGLIDPAQGGVALKRAKIDLLMPVIVFAIQKDRELDPLLVPLRLIKRHRIIEVVQSPSAYRRDITNRQSHRAWQYSQYFTGARLQRIDWSRTAIIPMPRFALDRLIAFEDQDGFAMGLGIIKAIDRESHTIDVLTSLSSLAEVVTIHIGDVYVDSQTYRDRRV